MRDSIDFNTKSWAIIFMIISFVFGILARYYWVYWAGGYDEMIFNDQIMINTNDGYVFAEGARDLIAGFHQPHDLSYVDQLLSKVTALLYFITPFKLETIILHMSSVFSSLVVIPLILIAKEFKKTEAGFIAALISVVAHSYYNRTMAGYYDTDMLNITLPCFILYGLILAVIKKELKFALIAPIFMIIYFWWYGSSYSLNLALTFMFLLYIFIFDRKNLTLYKAFVLLFISLMILSAYIKFILLFLCFYIFLKTDNKKIIASIFAICFLIFAFNGGLSPVLSELKFYATRNSVVATTTQLMFFNISNTIQEAGKLIDDFDLFMARISSHTIVFFLSLIGVFWVFIKNKTFILSLPFLGLGFISLFAGLRFTIYAVPIMGLGFGFFIVYLCDFFNIKKWFKFAFLSIVTALAIYPSLKHIYEYKTYSVFFNNEVKILDKFKTMANVEDYFVSWWDYGYPIRYYADVKTLVDGSKHPGDYNFLVSSSLFKDQITSANLARLAVEYTEREYNSHDDYSWVGKGLLIDKMMKDYNASNIDDFLNMVSSKDFKPPRKTREVYYYLPKRMMNIFNVITYFSNIDLKTGKSYPEPFFSYAYALEKQGNEVLLNNGFRISYDMKNIKINSQKIAVKNLFVTEYENSKLKVSEYNFNNSGVINIIYMKGSGVFVICDDVALNSSYVQMFMLERYDSELFEPVILDDDVKIYRLKR
ncbi:general glycosylation pathway protein [Campylobacter sp. FMV-PI01]|uniref:General glycosylation pathway protein n=1 Tax=Campylobacter portucalensis TaxID=2608384 RepID=A0A6L5WGX1_9BACT|nr:STT3 domain-containing protein [Campylobacter portucalensis]MSN95602.1 general glycosylation pathway protein [Campylobacter portucalensis]